MNIYTQIHQDYFFKLMEDWVMPDDWDDMSDCEPCVVPRVEYTRGEDHHLYGKPLSPEHREKISISKRGKNNPMCGISLSGKKNGMYGKGHLLHEKVKVGDKIFESCQSAAEYFGIAKGTMTYWIKTGKAIKV
jgi:hypothetical protein